MLPRQLHLTHECPSVSAPLPLSLSSAEASSASSLRCTCMRSDLRLLKLQYTTLSKWACKSKLTVYIHVTLHSLEQSCTRFLHACSALCKCADWLCRTCTPPPYRSRQIMCLSHSESVRLPLRNSSGPPLTSYMPGRAVPSLARVQAQQHTSSHTVRCARLVHLCTRT
jgi:hypothetical protein